jgi:hypothetical protein
MSLGGPLFDKSPLQARVDALRNDLLAESGPQISTMRNYRFAILPYEPKDEFTLRGYIRRLSDELKGKGWNVLGISLHQLFLDRLKAADPQLIESIAAREERLSSRGDPDRGLNHVKERIAPFIEGENGIASDVIRMIDQFADTYPLEVNRTLILLGRAGGLYPFFRSSSLLKHIDGKTRNLPVVLLYPGERRDQSALSFMGQLPADADYRPRIYS